MDHEERHARLATQADLDFVSQDGYLSRPAMARKIAQNEVFLVAKGLTPVGYLRLEYLWSLVPYIALIHVLEAYQNQGCSRILLAFVIDHLHQQGHHRLYSSSQANEPQPQSWHRHMGFEECGVINGINDGGVGEIFFRISF